MSNALPISRLISVSVNLSPNPAQIQNLSTLLILGSSSVIDTVERFRNYTDIAGVATDFGNSAPEYSAAVLWFEQTPHPTTLMIGRWAQTASHGKLIGATLPVASQSLATWTAITTGAFSIAVDGSTQNLSGLNFSAVTNLNGVASIVDTALANATVVWNANYARFEVTSTATGVTSLVGFATSPGSGTDISGLLGWTAASSGAYAVPGLAAETAISAVTTFDANYGQAWYALQVLNASNSDHLAVAAYIEAANTKHIYGITTQEAGVLVASDTTNIAYQMKALAYKRTAIQYSSSNVYAVASLFGRILTVDYNGNSTVITLMYKQEPGIVPESLNSNQIGALEGFNCNVFVAYNNSTAIIEKGVVASGDFLDIITGTDWLSLDIQNELFNLLYTSTTKVPQTDAGNHLLATTIEAVCSQAVTNGLLAPGVWQAGGFGALQQNDFLPKGFYVYAPPIATQNSANRAARKSVPIQVAVKLAGAIHTVSVIINVNR